MQCLACGMWDVRCLGCGMFRMLDASNVGRWGYRMFGMWNVPDVKFLRCGMFKIWNVGNVGC